MSGKIKRKRESIKSLTSYGKKVVLNTLKDINCNPQDSIQILNHFRDKSDKQTKKIKDFVEISAQKSQKKASNIPTKDFQNANRLVQYLDKCGCRKNCNFDVALALKTIADIEEHPETVEVCGIEMKKLYQTLTNLSMGYPTDCLGQESYNFLRDIYHDVMSTIVHHNDYRFRYISADYQRAVSTTDISTNILCDLPSDTSKNFKKFMENCFLNKDMNPLGIPVDLLTDDLLNKDVE